ncbi:hypothetical protein [Clostridioides difficile]|uniref:hypothetical protein n=1 Tax=Clostridioides difficile TaxID=1496 RepID=UPI001596C895|nr:hypothetical protein [Clostridioides difficile]
MAELVYKTLLEWKKERRVKAELQKERGDRELRSQAVYRAIGAAGSWQEREQ